MSMKGLHKIVTKLEARVKEIEEKVAKDKEAQ